MEQPARSPDCNPIDHIWDELGRAVTGMDNPSKNLGELCQALLDRRAEIPTERLQRLVSSMPRRLAAIIAARGGNTQYWSGIHKTTQTVSIMQKNQVRLTTFTIITIQWHLGMIMQPISPISINVITNLPKRTLNNIVHTIQRKTINPPTILILTSQTDRIWIIAKKVAHSGV